VGVGTVTTALRLAAMLIRQLRRTGAAGVTSIYRGQPGSSSSLDHDSDASSASEKPSSW
jgi:hypothetical protein